MWRSDSGQLCCAHCYRNLLTQRRRQREILCSACETSWLRQAEALLRQQLRPQADERPVRRASQTAQCG